MALLYFPKASNLGLRNAWDSTYQELTIACNPNMVLYFDTASAITAASASFLYITASWADTASWAINGGTTLITASTYQITASSAISASWAPSTPSDYSISASWASQSLSASWAPSTPSDYSISASWASQSLSASWAPANPS